MKRSALNVSKDLEQFIAMGCGSQLLLDIVQMKNNSCLCSSLTRKDNKRQGVHVLCLSQGRLKSVIVSMEA